MHQAYLQINKSISLILLPLIFNEVQNLIQLFQKTVNYLLSVDNELVGTVEVVTNNMWCYLRVCTSVF